MYKLFVAIRYLRRNRLNLIGVIAVAIGVLGLICVLSVMKGFDEEFRARIRATLSDLIIEDWRGEPFEGYEAVMQKVAAIPHVVACAPVYDGLGLLFLEKNRSQYAAFRGIELSQELKTTEFAEYWRAWRGRDAREQLVELMTGSADSPGSEAVKPLLSRMRRADFDYLDPTQREKLGTWAARDGFDLDAILGVGDTATPEWGTVSDPAKESPVFAGAEMLVIGRDVAGKFLTKDLGDRITLVTATGMFDDSRIVRGGRITGGFRSGLYDYDRDTLYLPLADVQRIMSKPRHITSINLRLDSFDNAPQVRAEILGILTADELAQGLNLVRAELKNAEPATLAQIEGQVRSLRERGAAWFAEGDPTVLRVSIEAERALLSAMGRTLKSQIVTPNVGLMNEIRQYQDTIVAREAQGIGYSKFRISTWEDKRRVFLRAVGLERRVMAFILFFLILIAGLLILSNMLTTVVSKTRDIGTLKSLGGSVRGIMSIFLLNGLLIGLVGSALGAAGGIALTRNINEIEAFLHRLLGFSLFPHEIYYLDRIPVDQHPWPGILVISGTAVIVSLLAAAYPAWKASRMDAVEALRYE